MLGTSSTAGRCPRTGSPSSWGRTTPGGGDDGGGGGGAAAAEAATTTTTTATTTMTATSSLLPPPGWNTIEFAIGDGGDYGADSWAFLRANSFSCAAASGAGAGGGATATSTTGGGGAGGDANAAPSAARSRIPLLHAVVILIFLGLIALSLPVIGLTFYNKRIPPG